jgi:hypothetical protein
MVAPWETGTTPTAPKSAFSAAAGFVVALWSVQTVVPAAAL